MEKEKWKGQRKGDSPKIAPAADEDTFTILTALEPGNKSGISRQKGKVLSLTGIAKNAARRACTSSGITSCFSTSWQPERKGQNIRIKETQKISPEELNRLYEHT